jgi:hypothetical protein
MLTVDLPLPYSCLHIGLGLTSGEHMSDSTTAIYHITGRPSAGFYESLNTRWHKVALQGFMAIVLFHWLEHIVQA